VVDQPDREPAGGDADVLVDVPVDDVVATALSRYLARLAPPQVVPDLLLKLKGDVLGDVAQPGALGEPLDEAALAAT
jgi:hypothetical protein